VPYQLARGTGSRCAFEIDTNGIIANSLRGGKRTGPSDGAADPCLLAGVTVKWRPRSLPSNRVSAERSTAERPALTVTQRGFNDSAIQSVQPEEMHFLLTAGEMHDPDHLVRGIRLDE
jgi:hypothetical protein